jgi:hypothetical protein
MKRGEAVPDEDLLRSLMRGSNVLNRADIPYALCGGLAVYARGGSSSDHDVDFMLQAEDVDRALHAFAAAGFGTERPDAPWLVKAYDGQVLIDLIHRPVDLPVTTATLADSEEIQVGATRLPVVSASQLLVHGLLRITAHECDFTGALDMTRGIREQIDFDRVYEQTAGSPYAKAFFALVEELGLLAKRD